MGVLDKRTGSCCRCSAMRSRAFFCFLVIVFPADRDSIGRVRATETHTGTRRDSTSQSKRIRTSSLPRRKQRPRDKDQQAAGPPSGCTAAHGEAHASEQRPWGSARGRPRSASRDFPDSRRNFCRYLNKVDGPRASRQNAWLEAKRHHNRPFYRQYKQLSARGPRSRPVHHPSTERQLLPGWVRPIHTIPIWSRR